MALFLGGWRRSDLWGHLQWHKAVGRWQLHSWPWITIISPYYLQSVWLKCIKVALFPVIRIHYFARGLTPWKASKARIIWTRVMSLANDILPYRNFVQRTWTHWYLCRSTLLSWSDVFLEILGKFSKHSPAQDVQHLLLFNLDFAPGSM